MSTVNVELFGTDPKIQKALKTAGNIAVTKVPVLVVGEAGVGKKSLAKYIHSLSSRKDHEIKFVDCAESQQQVENAILGYRDEEGRFVKGVLESGNKGTVVLSNIDHLEENFQRKLHKILTELEDYDLDIRIIGTTTNNLSKLVGAGRFYRGLYMYISSNTITLTPLRDRLGDLEMIANHFLAEYNQEFGKNVTLDDNVKQRILKHYWTHNILELMNVIKNAVSSANENTINDNDLEIGEKKAVSVDTEDNSGIQLMSLKEVEKLLIKKALIHTSENRTQAAKILGVSIRTLRNKINEYRNEGHAYFVNLR